MEEIQKCEALILEYKSVNLAQSTSNMIKEIEERLKELYTDHPKRIRLIIENEPCDRGITLNKAVKPKRIKKKKYINNTIQINLMEL